MKNYISTCILILLFTSSFGKSLPTEKIDYVKNEGQWQAPILYKANLYGGWAFLENNGITFKFLENKHQHPTRNNKVNTSEIIKGHAYKINWLNANPNTKIESSDTRPYYHNYFLGKDKSKWKSNVGVYNTITYRNIYSNIDFKFYSSNSSMKSDYTIHKNGYVQDLQFQYQGVDAIEISKEGKLKITTSINTIYELQPYAYQNINGKQIEVACQYVLNKNILSFQLPKGYNKNYDLVIDPILVFSTYSGSFSDNWGSSATNDAAGNMFLGGIAFGSSFPTTLGAFQTTYNGGTGNEQSDVVITKLNSSGTAMLYSTYLGGTGNELLASLHCTPQDELIAVMTTSSADFPTSSNAYDKTFNGGTIAYAMGNSIEFLNGSDIVLTKLNSNGTAIIGSTYFGGNGNDGLNLNNNTNFNYGDDSRSDIAIDKNGNIFITSTTNSTNIPGTSGKAQPNNKGSFDGVVAKFNTNLSTLNWATYFGGTNADASYSLVLDKDENIFICGGTTSNDLPNTIHGLHPLYQGGMTDGFITKIDKNGNAILTTTYLGTNDYDQAYIMDIDLDNNVYVFGQTLGNYSVSSGVYSDVNAKQFIHKLNNNLDSTFFSTVFGTANSSEINITPTALLVDVCYNIYAVGWGGFVNNQGTTFGMPVTADAFKSTTDGSDFYLINLSANAANLGYATYFGEDGGIGDHVDGGTSRFDKNGIVYQAVCASCGGTNDFPTTTGVVGPNNNAFNCNMAGFKFDFKLTGLQIITASATPQTGCNPMQTQFNYTATQPGKNWFWDFGDGDTSTVQYPTHTYIQPGTYSVLFILSDPNNCNPLDSTRITVVVNDKKTLELNEALCQGDSIKIGQYTFNQTGNYVVTLTTTEGCDSTITLHLTVLPNQDTVIEKTICEGERIQVGNHIYTQSGNYIDTLTTTNGCDSIVQLHLTVNPTYTISLNEEICEGDSIVIGNKVFNQTGNFVVTLKTTQGCDSIIQLILLVHPQKNTTINRTICTGNSTTIGNHVYNTTGTYMDTMRTSFGCDSIITLHLLVTDTIVENLNQTICAGDVFSIQQQTFTQEGDYKIYLQAVGGCDSLINLHLNVIDTAKANISRSICEGDSVTIANQIFKTEGNYIINLNSANGCDSLLNLTITVLPKKRFTLDTSICAGEKIQIGNQIFSQAGDYEINLTSAQGCDSIILLNLSINPLPIINAIADKDSAEIGEPIQLDVQTSETLQYNWTPIDLLNNAQLQNPIATIQTPTWFNVIATNPQTTCNATDSVFVDILYIPCTEQNIYLPNAFSPNGDGINDTYLVRSKILKNMHLEIYNRWGLKVFESDSIVDGWDGKFKGQPAPQDAYGYIFNGECIQGEKISIKGNITLVR
ncbi:MAG: PKD domain-containing protein [Chitinophagales bacterium]